MRLRNITGAKEAIEESIYVVQEPVLYKGKWSEVFNNQNPIRLEIGMGKGRFLYTLAERFKEINYIGIEKYSSVLYRGIQKMEEAPLPNLRFICMDAEDITNIFAKGEIDCIYLNFSDPWPKDRHAKRRLPSKEFLNRYDEILKRDGQIEFKTDNVELFAFAEQELKDSKWNVKALTYDLHSDEILMEGNVMTEYEEKFSSKGNPICKYIITR
ncbi:tRNA (guanosine(46)-N7)-methyltransferase TrmB [Lachnospiraceae bacterium OttesenSCG-928-D06]|nr:tRNA (guanosine(46)-N7)-methyltransferase TrmB [Lachnospiraceae bacterium OttesenSCG-928-D06]